MLRRHSYHAKRYLAMSNLLNNIEHLVERGASFQMVVTGYSMLPLLGYGRDSIILHRTNDDEDIMHRAAMFRMANGRIIVHRVIAIDNGIVTLRGDGNLTQTEQCHRNEIIGVVDKVVRENGKVVSCTTRWWRIRERIWLCQPYFVRRYALAIMRRWLNFKRGKQQ